MDVPRPDQCVALTDKGKGPRCQYKGKHVHPTTGQRYCGHHYKPATMPTNALVPKLSLSPIMPKPADLVIPFQLRRKVAQRLRRRFEAGPKSNDEPGIIYVYFLQHEEARNYFKVGRTSRDLEKRHKEWQAQHDPAHVVVTKKSWKVESKAVKFLERVIHLWFDYCRMYRYPVGKTGRILSVWSSTGAPIHDPDYVALEEAGEEERLVAKRKMVEWFWVMWPELDALITKLCTFYSPAAPSKL